MKKLFIAFLLLVVVGVGLTAYLPAPTIKQQASYSIDDASLDSPLQKSAFQLDTIPEEGQLFALLLGTYSDLTMAIRQAEKLHLNSLIYIVIYEDGKRLWYALVLGDYASEHEARVMQQELNVSSSVIRQPIKHKAKD